MKQLYRHMIAPSPTLSFKICFIVILLMGGNSAYSQYDIEYYMPPIWNSQASNGGSNSGDNGPTEIVITTAYPTSEVTMRTPDNSFTTTFNVTKGSPVTTALTTASGSEGIDQTSNINTIETDKGLIITSDYPIQAVYRQVGGNNQAIVTLKGRFSLGQEFYAGSQTNVRETSYGQNDLNFISVMATEDNTTVNIDLPGTTAYIENGATDLNYVTVTLDQYETYLVRGRFDQNATDAVAGAYITSDKDIAVTSGGQHIRGSGVTPADAGIDQIVPTGLLGDEYVLVRGGTGSTSDYAVIIGVTNGTEVKVDGSGTPITTLSAGEVYEYQLTGGLGTPHLIETSADAYVYHVSGLNSDEVGMAAFPAKFCTGSTSIQFTRFGTGMTNTAQVVMATSELSSFTLNTTKTISTMGLTTTTVPGRSDLSVFTIPDSEISTDNLVEADDFFQLGVIVANGSSGTYGFLTGYDASVRAIYPEFGLPTPIYIADTLIAGNSITEQLEFESCGSTHFITSVTLGSSSTGASVNINSGDDTQIDYHSAPFTNRADTAYVTMENDLGITGIVRMIFYSVPDLDSDGISDNEDLDDDNDGITDLDESGGTDPSVDANFNGIIDFQDPAIAGYVDSNGDGVNDNFDTDLDGVPNYSDLDSDNDGIYDVIEAGHGVAMTSGRITSGVGTNGLADAVETVADNGTINYTIANTDAAGDPDYQASDSDSDGCSDTREAGFTDGDNDGVPGSGTETFDASTGVVQGITYPATVSTDYTNNTVFTSCPTEVDLDGSESGFDFETVFLKSGSASPVADADGWISSVSTTIQSITVTLTNSFNGSNETLGVDGALPGGITVTDAYDNADGILTISGPAPLADFETALKQIVYNNVSVNPNNEDRTITVSVNDGSSTSNTATTTMAIKFPPVLTAVGPAETTLEETEVEIDFLEITNNGDESDADGTVVAFIVKSVTSGTLRVGADVSSATAYVLGVNDTIKLGSKAFWTPDLNESGTLSAFEIVALDNEDFESIGNVIVPVVVTEVNDLPVAADDTGTTVEDTPVTIVDITSNDTDVDGTINRATITLIDPSNALNTGNRNSPLIIAGEGTYSVDNVGNLTFTPDVAFSGTASVYYTVQDDLNGTSNVASVDITVSGNTAPVIDLDANDGSGVSGADYANAILDVTVGDIIVDSDVSITDATDTYIESATITLTNRPDGINETLTVEGTLPAGISISDPYSNADGKLVLSGTAELDDYQNALKLIRYSNVATNEDTSDRIITIIVNDGTDDSNTATTTFTIGCDSYPQFTFASSSYVGGSGSGAGTVGAQYNFPNVDAPTNSTYAIIEITAMQNAQLKDIDDTSLGYNTSFQPVVDPLNTGSLGDVYIDFKISFFNNSDDSPKSFANMAIISQDIDGNNTDRDYVGYKDSPGVVLQESNNINRDQDGNFVTFESSTTAGVSSTDATAQRQHTVYGTFANTPYFEIRAGIKYASGANNIDRILLYDMYNTCIISTLNPFKSTPNSASKTITLDEDETFNFSDIDFSFKDMDGDGFEAIVISSLPTNGTLNYNGSTVDAADVSGATEFTDRSLFAFVPDADESGNPYANFIFQVKDDSNHPETEFAALVDTIYFKIYPVNDSPVASDDSFTLLEGGTLTVDDADGTTTGGDATDDGVLVNDVDVDGDALTIALVTGPAYNASAFTLNADGTFEYVHDGSENFTDSFTYSITDPSGVTSTATVNITITPVNDAPSIDLDGDNSSGATAFDYFTSFQEGGSPTAIADSDVTIADGDLADNIESVTIILNNRPDGALESLAVSGTLPGSLTITDAYDNADGQLVISGTGTAAEYQQAIQLVVYENMGVGVDVADRNVTVVVNDGDDNSNTATTNIIVSPGDDFDNDGIKDINDLDDDNDGIPDSQEYCADGGFACLPGGFDPSGDEDGDGISNFEDADDVNFSSGCTDGNADGICDVLVAAYDPDGDGIPNHHDYNSDGDNCSDADEAGHGEVVLTGGIITGPYGANGLANRVETFDESGNIDYTISEKVSGTYDAQSATCDQCVPALDLDANNSTIAGADYSTSFSEGDINIKISDTDTDITDINDVKLSKVVIILSNRPDGTAESLTVLGSLPAGISITDVYNNNDGQLVLSGEAAISSYEAAIEQIVYNNTSTSPDETTRQIQVTVHDSENASNTAISYIGVAGSNSAPVASADTNAITEGTGTVDDSDGSGTLISNDTDDDGDGLIVTSINGISTAANDVDGTYGTLGWNTDGSYTYTLDNSAADGLAFGETVTESFTYTVSDGNGGTDTETLTITITGANDNPVAFDDSNQISENGTSIDEADGSGTLISNDTDVDGDNLNVASITSINEGGTSNDPGTSVTGEYGTLVWNNDGTYTYTRNGTNVFNNSTAIDEFDYTVSDANGTDVGRLTITILGQNVATRTITVTAQDASGTEGSDDATFRISRTGSTTAISTVNYTITGSATSGSDFTSLSGTTSIGIGSAFVDVTVSVIDDALAECSDETVIMTLVATGTQGTIGTPSSATVTISDNDLVTPSLTISDECSGDDITVDVSGASNLPDGTYDVDYNIDGGGTQTVNSVSFSSGMASFTVSGAASGSHTLNLIGICDKVVSGASDGFTVNVPSSASMISGTTSICSGESSDLAVNITGGTSPYTLQLSDGTIINNYTSGSAISVSPTSTTTYTVASIEDATGCTGSGNTGSATVTVNNGSTAATINGATTICAGSSADLTVSIVGGASPYTVQLSDGTTINSYTSGSAITVSPTSTTAYTITSVVDSNGCTGTGNTATATVTVTPIPGISVTSTTNPSTFGGNDGAIELAFTDVPDGTYTLDYAAGTFGSVNIESGALTINNLSAGDYNDITLSVNGCATSDDVDVTIAQSATLDIALNSNGAEPSTNVTFTVSMDKTNNTGSGITVNYTFSGGTATGGVDYNSSTTSVVIPDGASSATITVPVIEDTDLEATESVQVTLSATGLPGGMSLGTSAASGDITDDDVASATITASDASANETPTDNGEFTVSLNKTNNTGSAITVTYNIGGSATPGAGNDYTALSGTVAIPDGQSSVTIPVVVLNDGTLENSETVVVTLVSTDLPAATIGAPGSATVTINDDDASSITINNASAAEGSGVQFTVTLTGDVQGDVSVDVSFAGGNAIAGGTDYTSTTQQFTFSGGIAGSQNVNVPLSNDDLIEGDETFIASISLVSGHSSVDVSDTGVGTIEDADGAITEWDIVTAQNGEEGGTDVIYTVSLSDGTNALTNNTGSAITVDIAFATGSDAVQGDLT
ncbi:MAG: Ig-like domain-containing protein, partial [Cyclobacteriaceae bacterium]